MPTKVNDFLGFLCNLNVPLYLYADIDECATNETNECDPNALCTNTEGSYICRCLKGYEGDGRNCKGMMDILSKEQYSRIGHPWLTWY